MRTIKYAALATTALTGIIGVLAGAQPVFARSYRVRPGDTFWAISRRTGIREATLVRLNHPRNPNFIIPGEIIELTAAPRPHRIRTPRPAGIGRPEARVDLMAAAQRHGLNAAFVLAVSWWESGWNQSAVSRDGAIGLMQIMPATAAWAGPHLLGHRVDIRDPRQNADLGAALLRRYLDRFGSPQLALAAYYQGASAVEKHGIFKSSRRYVDGIWDLRWRFMRDLDRT
ncbi:MAG: lytic transglycosylase domain-containing protein [Candidatus Dormibacteraceae bacterium]